MIALPSNYPEKQVSLFTGEVRVLLPTVFKNELDKAIDLGLARMPAKGRQKLKECVRLAVGAVLSAADFQEILQQEIQREILAKQTEKAAKKRDQLLYLKRKHAAIIEEFEKVIFSLTPSKKRIKNARNTLFKQLNLIDSIDAAPLKVWAENLAAKALEIRA